MARATKVLQILQAARQKLLRDLDGDVFGLDFGKRLRRGLKTKESTLRVYVEKKAGPRKKSPTVSVRHGTQRVSYRADVIATGGRPVAADGEPSSFSGLHDGAAIVVADERFGAVGLLLAVGGEVSHFVTAGHLFRSTGASTTNIEAARRGGSKRRVGRVQVNLLDERPGDLDFSIDAALVELMDGGRKMAEATRENGAPVPHLLVEPSGEGVQVQAFRPTTGGFSAVTELSASRSSVLFRSVARPDGYRVQDVLRAKHDVTRPGDSGTCFLLADAGRAAVGTCIGSDGRSSFLEPLARSIGYFCAATGMDLQIWSGSE